VARRAIASDDAPKALGPYSQAVVSDPFVFLAGQTPVDPATGQLVDGGITEQAEQVFANLTAVLVEAGLSLDDVVKVNVYLTDIANDFAALNAVYATKFSAPYPARTTVCVAGLPMGACVEIEMVARRP
jgi:2-iminobutanoate/2-iminopropanoate deaminase